MIITTKLINSPYDAFTIWPFIFVRPESRKNNSLIQHELIHYNSMAWITPIWWLRYTLSKSFRWEQEVKAYRVQIGCGGIRIEDAATLLLTHNTGHTEEQVMQALTHVKK